MRRVVIAIVALLVVGNGTAYADEGGARIGPRGPEVWVSGPGQDPPSAGGSGTVTCQFYEVGGYQQWPGTGDPATSLVEGQPYWLVCSDGYVNLIIYNPATIVDPGTLARRAYNELPLIYPQPRTAPPITSPQVVGIRTWLWIDPSDWASRSATASIVGLSATVTARPTKVTWTMGDATTVTCDGPGTPYDTTVPDADQSTTCGHVYQHDGAYTVLVTIVWTVSWTATNGQGGTLADVRRSTQFPLSVEQRQAVITG